jgi:Mononegavirales RNA dependent RNA polymerase
MDHEIDTSSYVEFETTFFDEFMDEVFPGSSSFSENPNTDLFRGATSRSASSTAKTSDEPKKRLFYHNYQNHLSLPICIEKIDFYRQKPDKWKRRFPGVPFDGLVDLSTGQHNGYDVAKYIVNKFKSLSTTAGIAEPRMIHDVISKAAGSVRRQEEVLTRGLTNRDPTILQKIITAAQSNLRLEKLFAYKQAVLKFKEELSDISISGLQTQRLKLFPDVVVDSDMFLLENFPGGKIIVPYTMIVDACDKIESEFSFFLYITLVGGTNDNHKLNYYEFHQIVYDKLDAMRYKHGNNGVNLLKALNPMVTGLVLDNLSTGVNDTEYYTLFKQDFLTEHPELRADFLDLEKLYLEYLKKHGEAAFPLLLESYGNEKMHHLPIVDVEKGLIRMFAHGTKIMENDQALNIEIDGMTKLTFTVEYYREHRKLPKIVFNSSLHPKIYAIWRKKSIDGYMEANQIPLEEWSKITYDKNLTFNYFTDPLDMMDDKATCPELMNINEFYSLDVLKEFGEKKPFTKQSRKLLIRILESPEVNIESYFAICEKNGSNHNMSIVGFSTQASALTIC